MAADYSLDVAFSSDTNYTAGDPITMAYGFVGTDGSDQGQTPGAIVPGNGFAFAVFDTAENPGTVTQIQISFGEGVTPFVDNNGDAVPNPVTVTTGLQSTEAQWSIGCNVTGARWVVGGFIVSSHIPADTPFECTMTVNVTDSAGNEKVFSVDPEIIVEGAN